MSEYREQLTRIETNVEALRREFADHRVEQEHRVTKLETKAGLFGLIGGAISGLMAHLIKGGQ